MIGSIRKYILEEATLSASFPKTCYNSFHHVVDAFLALSSCSGCMLFQRTTIIITTWYHHTPSSDYNHCHNHRNQSPPLPPSLPSSSLPPSSSPPLSSPPSSSPPSSSPPLSSPSSPPPSSLSPSSPPSPSF